MNIRRDMLTARGRRIVTALLAARKAAFVEVANEDEDGFLGLADE